MDQIDKQILKLLQDDAKLTTKEIAAKVGISTTPVYERIKRLEANGVLEYKAVVNRSKMGYDFLVFCLITLNNHEIDTLTRFEKHIDDLDEVLENYHVAGSSDYILKVVARDIDHYQKFLVEKLSSTKDTSNIQSVIVLGEKKHTLNIDF
jgi:Lrp/AsnC family transcriptional regulator, leucine-responsive regulatory protein